MDGHVADHDTQATWKVVSHLTARALEKVSDQVIDIQGSEPDEDEEEDDDEDPVAGSDAPDGESKKDL